MSEHLFENLLQRRAKPIRWKWSKDLAKTSDTQRQRRFLENRQRNLPEETTVKWWREMAPQKDSDTNVFQKDSISLVEETYFRKPSHSDSFKKPRLAETSKGHNLNSLLSNRTQSFREELNVRQGYQSSYGNFLKSSIPIEPFDNGDVFDAENYLSPTEKTFLSDQYFPPAFESLQNIPQQKELEHEDYEEFKTEDHANHTPQYDIESELLREAIIQERHKPSKFEIQSANQRFRDSTRNERNFKETSMQQSMSSVEYVVPSVEHVLPQVEYTVNNSSPVETEMPLPTPIVEYVSPTVEFVEPDTKYAEQFNTSDDSETTFVEEDPLSDDEEEIIVFEEELPNEWPTLEKNENEGIEKDGAKFKIIGLRREQVRVRRNHRRSLQLGLSDTDYPTLEALPVLQFYCGDYLPGYYVDITTRCQVFHICHEDGRRSSFLCPVGTIFNQEYLVCDWWYNVDCESSSKYYSPESLQAYGTNNEKQRVMPNPITAKETVIEKQDFPKPGLLVTQNANKDTRKKNQNSRLSNLSQKAINYPVGYAILLREYMKNSGITNRDSNRSDYYSSERDKKERNLQTSDQAPRDEFKRGKKNFSLRNHSQDTDNYEKNRYFEKSKPYTPVQSYQNEGMQRRKSSYYKTPDYKEKNVKPYIHKPSDATNYPNQNSSRSELRSSFEEESPLDEIIKATEVEKETLKNLFHNQKKEQSIRKTTEVHSSGTNKNPLNKTPSDISKYHFIINPREAVIPASTQYASLDQHLKNNNSAIKFRHAESIIKHIQPRARNKFPTIKSQKFISKDDDGRNYNLTKTAKDNIYSNSAPSFSKTSRPVYIPGHQYGQRLSTIKSRSIRTENERINNLNTTGENNSRNLKSDLPFTVPRNLTKWLLNNTKQLKTSQSQNNYTYAAVPLESEKTFNTVKINKASDIFIDNYRAEKVKTLHKTKFSPDEKNKKENESVNDKRKITISTQIEKKEVLLKDINKTNIPQNKDILKEKTSMVSQKLKDISDHPNRSSLHVTRPVEDFYKNLAISNKTQAVNSNTQVSLMMQNVTKINNTYGGYAVMKVSGKSSAPAQNRNKAMKDPVYKEQQPNRTISKKLYIISD